jgi:hypothetical protein
MRLPLWCSVEDDRQLQLGSEGFRECAERLKPVSIAADELASPVLDLGQSAKTIIFDLEQPVLMRTVQDAIPRLPRSQGMAGAGGSGRILGDLKNWDRVGTRRCQACRVSGLTIVATSRRSLLPNPLALAANR